MAKIQRVEKCRKEQKCSKCGNIIPVGSPYLYAEPMYRPKIVRCIECGLQSWETSGSEFVQTCGDIQTNWRDNYDIEGDAACNIRDDLESLRDTIQENLDNMPEQLQEGETGQMMQERIEMLEGVMNELESITDFDNIVEEVKEERLDEWKQDNDIDEEADLDEEQTVDFDEFCRECAWTEMEEQIDEALSGLEY